MLFGIIPPLPEVEFSMQIPTEADWRSQPWGIDMPYAYRHFSGKDMEAAIRLFEEDALTYQEDLMFMPVACFHYYAHAYISYLLSPKSQGNSDGASCFFGLVRFRLEDIRNSDPQLVERVKEVLVRLRDNQKWYKAQWAIYGSFKKKAESLLKKLKV